MDTKVTPEAAAAEFERFIEANDIDVNESFMDAEDRTAFNKQKRRLLRAIESGALVINEQGEAIYTPQNSDRTDPLHFRQRTGASLMAADRKKKGEDAGKMYAIMGDMARCEPKCFAALKGTDIKVCEAIFALLMD